MRKRMIAWVMVLALGTLTACKKETKEPDGTTAQGVQEMTEEPIANAQDLSDAKSAYLQVLSENEEAIRESEKAASAGGTVADSESSRVPSCMYSDITGDGIPELFFRCYAPEFALGVENVKYTFPLTDTDVEILPAFRVFSYDPEQKEAREILHFPNTSITTSLRAVASENWKLYKIEGNRLAFSNITTWGDLADMKVRGDLYEFELRNGEYKCVSRLAEGKIALVLSSQMGEPKQVYSVNDRDVSEDDYKNKVMDYLSKTESIPYVGGYEDMVSRLKEN